MATHGYMSERRPSISSHSVALTLLPTLSRSTVLHWSFSSFSSVCASPLSSTSIFVSDGILEYLPPYTHIFVTQFQEARSPRQVIHIDDQSASSGCQDPLSFLKSSLRFKCRQQHSLHIQYQNLHNLIFTSVPSLLYSGKWDSDGEREGRSESHPWMDYHYSGDSKNSKGPDTQAKLTRMSKYDKLKIVRVRQTVFCLRPILPLAPTA